MYLVFEFTLGDFKLIFLQLAILSHILSDFVFQTNKMVQAKQSDNKKVFLRAHRSHSFIVFITSFILLFFPCSPDYALIYSSIIAALHYLIDILKYKLTSEGSKENFISFILDQILHIAVIFVLWGIFEKCSGNHINWMNNLLYHNFGTALSWITKDMAVNSINILIVYTFVCWGGAVIVDLTLDLLGINSSGSIKDKQIIKNSNNDTNNLLSKYIGVFERLIIMTLVIKNAYSAIAFVFAAKSLARANDIIKKEEHFAEYYLIGTLLSTSIAMLGGILLYHILGYK